MFAVGEILREHIIEMEVLMNNNQNLNKNNSLSKVFWGLLLILGAAALILDKLGYWPLYDISIFSLILTLCFIARNFTHEFYRNIICTCISGNSLR